MSKTTLIKASSRASVKVRDSYYRDSYYTVEYTEERSIDEQDNVDTEREKLWNDVNNEVDNQISEIFNTFKK